MKEKLKHEAHFSPAFDKRNPDPKKNYGIGAVGILFVVIGKKGAISIRFGTNWYLPTTIDEYKKTRNTDLTIHNTEYPLKAWSWDYHSKKKQYKHQCKVANCRWLNNKPCYCDGSGLKADSYLDILIKEGSEGIYKKLEEDYYKEFTEIKKVKKK